MTIPWVEPVYDDPRVAHVYGVMSEQMLSTEVMESCDKSLEKIGRAHVWTPVTP